MMKKNEIKVGDTYSEKIVEDLKRTQIVQYAGASGAITLYIQMINSLKKLQVIQVSLLMECYQWE